MPVKSKTSRARTASKSEPKNEMYEAHDCCFGKDCSRTFFRQVKNMDFGRKILYTLIGILLVYAIVFLGTLIRNNLQEFYFIGKTEQSERTLTIDGIGKVSVVPDVAMTTMGMLAEAPTVAEAQAQNTQTMNQLIERLKSLGIESADIQTANYQVYPQYDYTEEEGQVLRGYQVSQNVHVKIRNLDQANRVLALAGEVGINNVSGINFTLDDKEVYQAEARRLALQKVYEKAQMLEENLGVHLGEIVTYSEYEESGDVPAFRSYAKEAIDLAPTPNIEPGTNDLVMRVNVVFEIK